MAGRFASERVVVIGLAVAGRAAAEVLASEGADVVVTEARDVADLGELASLRALGVQIRAGGHEPAHLDGADWVFTSPGVPDTASPIRWARARGLQVRGELELGTALARAPLLAVTGTNGKTTTAGMLAACLRAAGLDAVACGNIGRPFPAAARGDHDALVVECSSFQLAQQTSFHPRISALLNVAPDHLDWHGSFDAYLDAKAAIVARQEGDDVHVGNRDDPVAAEISSRARCRVVWCRLGEPDEGEVGYVGGELVARLDGEVRLSPIDAARAGYQADAAAAAAAALSFGIEAGAVATGLVGFEPARHRGDVVAVAEGVRFIDNSKATNVHAALAAIDGVQGAVLIAGGRAKGVDLSPLATRWQRLRAVVAIGEAAEQIEDAFRDVLTVHRAASIEAAVAVARELAGPGGTVLLAPACASWDMFSGYEERGERFAAAARALTHGAAARG